MFLRQTLLSVIILCCCTLNGLAQKQALTLIDTADLKQHLSYLAADELMGRKLGTKPNGLELAATYLAQQAQQIGLKAIENSYYQQVKTYSRKYDAKNVIGIVEGSDPVLKNEYVVFMAHYDHLGVRSDGAIFNGADDNGSGCVAILEVAEAFASLRIKPKRSIVFLWVTCEEIGHVGSRYYCDNPIFPLQKTVAAINLDMVGRVYEFPRDDAFKSSPKQVKPFNELYVLTNDIWPKLEEITIAKCDDLKIEADTSLPKSKFLRASDHYHFHKNGVPILNFSTGYHADFHKVSDEVEKINFLKIKRVADLCFLVAYDVANLDKNSKTIKD